VWSVLTLPPEADGEARALAAELRVSITAASVLIRRGHAGAAQSLRFFDPRLRDLTPPGDMRDRTVAVERLARAVRARERVCVFGDYDADGVTSTALMADVLGTLGGEVVTVLANRFDGGYGLSAEALERVLETGATTLVTCDCGTSDHERLDVARRRGVDVIVIDHHRVPEEELPAYAFLNPHRPGCSFPYKGLASVGLAFSICAGVRAALGVDLDMRRWLDLVALGTIADVAPLDGDNRALVRAGLGLLAKGLRPGTRALASVAGHAAGLPLTGEDVAFRFAPRINAPGRLGEPDLALRLLLASDETAAHALALEVDGICEHRKRLDRAILAEAVEMLRDPALASLPVIVLGKEGWHPGVVGIVAGRLASRFGKPAIVVGLSGGSGPGSVRGPAGFPLYDALERVKDVLLGFGGHQAAAGVRVEGAKLDALRERFAAAAVEMGAAAVPSVLMADAQLAPGDDPAKVLRDFERFEPCGSANPTPRLALAGATVSVAREVTGGHLQLELELGSVRLRGFGVEMGPEAPVVGSQVHVTGRLRPDRYRGDGAVELKVEALEPA
jgi:single-stranded-DNA-specific exonuclease